LHADADPARRPGLVPEHEHIPDDRLQLMFACCHPALDLDAQTGLTLRYVAGLSTAQIAQAFLVPPATMAQRLTRGKRKIQHSRIPFRVPGPDELEGRLGLVLHVIYLIFTEGYAATGHHDLVRCDLVDEAIRLARILHRLMPGEPRVTGLLALMLLTDARRPARVDGHGIAVSLEDQDRGLWDTSMIDEGTRLATQALTHHPPNSWSVQAAIAALHDEAPTAQETDWHQVRLLYDELFALTPTPVVALNRAIAISWHEGPQAGLDHLEALAGEPSLARQHHWHAARGHTLARLGCHTAAAEAYRRASELAQTPAEIAYLSARAEKYTTPG
jgi:RNA polymerase sigma-70 factor (ECF subfamily)